MIELIPVSGSTISRIGYDRKEKTLAVEFKPKGTLYLYEDVPFEVYVNMLKAESASKFLKSNIEGKYKYRKADDNNN